MTTRVNTESLNTFPCVTNKKIQEVLLVTTVAFGVLTLIPPLRFVGAVGLRASALLSSINLCAKNWDKSTHLNCCLMATKVVLVALGITGVILGSPLILIASIAIDTVLQMKGVISALQERKMEQALIHLGMLTVNLLFITAIAAGSWQIIVAASVVSCALMLYVIATIIAKSKGSSDPWLEIVAYLALIGIGVAGLCTMMEITHRVPTQATFDLHNKNNYTQYIYAKDGHLVATIAPGGSVHLELPYKDLIQMKDAPGGNTVGVLRVEAPDAPWYAPSSTVRQANAIDYNTEIVQKPIAPDAMLHTALGGTAIVTEKLA